MATIRQWLNKASFNWEKGDVVVQEMEEDGYSPGWAKGVKPRIATQDDPILNVEFDSGMGAPHCPRFFARDDKAVYFPGQYDGATWIETVNINPDAYLGDDFIQTPYPGG